MSVKRVPPEEANELLQQGYVFVDVRSIPEFEAGHPKGAYNVPLMHRGAAGMKPNPEFMNVMQATFDKDAKLVLGCRSGGRSLRAANLLVEAGFADVIDQRAGWGGTKNPFGQVTQQGWQAAGLPSATEPEEGRDWASLAEGASGD